MIPLKPIKQLEEWEETRDKVNELIDTVNYLIGYVRGLRDKIDPEDKNAR